MAELFTPTFRASSVDVPNIPGADVGAFGKAILDMRLNSMREKELAWKEADRNEEERVKGFLKSYNYDPNNDDSALDKSALQAYNESYNKHRNAILKNAGITDTSVNVNSLPENVRGKLNALDIVAADTKSRIPRSSENIYNSVMRSVVKETGDARLGDAYAKMYAANGISRDDFSTKETNYVKEYNAALERRANALKRVLDVDKDGYVKPKNHTVDDINKYIKDSVDIVGGVDATAISEAADAALKTGLSPNRVMQALVKLRDPEAYGIGKLFSGGKKFKYDNPEEFTAFVDKYTEDYSSGNSRLSPEQLAILQPNYVVPRDYNTAMRDSGTIKFNDYGGRQFPGQQTVLDKLVSTNLNNTTRDIKVVSGTDSAVSTPAVNLMPERPKVVSTSQPSDRQQVLKTSNDNGRLLDRFINFGNNTRTNSSGMLREFLTGSEEPIMDSNDIMMKIAVGKPITRAEYDFVYKSLPAELKKAVDKRGVPTE